MSLILSSCAAIPKGAVQVTPETILGIRRGDSEIGAIGGGGDSIALWLAIAGLAATPILGAGLYQFGFRPFRLWRENGRKRNNQGVDLCVKYSRWGSPSPSSPDVPVPPKDK